MKNSWVLITCFKNEWKFIETFLSYYEDIWGIDNFYINFGYSDKKYLELLKVFNAKRILPDVKLLESNYNNFFASGNINNSLITFYCYQTNDQSDFNEWNYIKRMLFSKADNYLDKKFNKIINIDSDEYLFSSEIKQIKSGEINEKTFHYLEVVPNSEYFNKCDDLVWCVQGWYPMFIGKGKTSEPDLSSDKRFFFNRIKIMMPWLHSNNIKNWQETIISDTSKKIYAQNRTESINEIINSGDVCYHLSSPDKETFDRRLRNFSKTKTGYFDGMHVPKDFESTKDPSRYYETFIDNRLKKYIK